MKSLKATQSRTEGGTGARMAFLMGIDLGTSSVKVLIQDEAGKTQHVRSRSYPIDVPCEGCAEQSPVGWWEATSAAISEAIRTSGVPAAAIKCVGLSGQMHGTVLINKQHQAIGPAIIHCDQRSGAQVNRVYQTVGRDAFHAVTRNPLFPGFQLATLRWLLENEPERYHKAALVLSPKDYVRLQMTGEAATEYSDASATLAFDMNDHRWADEIITSMGLKLSKFPPIYRSLAIAGEMTAMAAAKTGLARGTPVILGGADQPMQALGNGAVLPGVMTSTIGTGGQIFTPIRTCRFDESYRTLTFHNLEPQTYYALGAILNAGLCLKWLNEKVLHYPDFNSLSAAAEAVPPSSLGLLFLPYLTGERVPFAARPMTGSFIGLTLQHDGAAMARAVMEGVVFALRERVDAIGSAETIHRVIASGGGANSRLWLQLQADIYNREIFRSNMTEQACTGAAMAAGTAIGIYKDLAEACRRVVKLNPEPVTPKPENVKRYDAQYARYLELARQYANDETTEETSK